MEILLIPFLSVILVILFFDLKITYKIYSKLKNGKSLLSDERYFELKFKLNLFQAIAAILIFFLGFFGYNTYTNFRSNVLSEVEESVNKQKEEIKSISDSLAFYKQEINSLIIEKNSLHKSFGISSSELQIANQKIANIFETLKYYPHIYVVNNVEIDIEKVFNADFDADFDHLPLYNFRDLITIYGEKLPKFNSPPAIIIQAKGAELMIGNVTNESFEIITVGSYFTELEVSPNIYQFNVWIASFD